MFHLGAIFCCGSVTKTHTIGQSIGSLRAHWRLTGRTTRAAWRFTVHPQSWQEDVSIIFDPSPHLDEATLRLYVFSFSTRTVPNYSTLIELLQFKQLKSSTAPRPRGLSISEPGSQALLVIKWMAHVFGRTPSHIFFWGGRVRDVWIWTIHFYSLFCFFLRISGFDTQVWPHEIASLSPW